MSNNRMWLRNVRTGKQILLAKYYPSSGWFPAQTFTKKALGVFLDEDELPLHSRANPADGDNECGVVYECGEPNEGETVQDPVTGRWRAKP